MQKNFTSDFLLSNILTSEESHSFDERKNVINRGEKRGMSQDPQVMIPNGFK